MARTGKNTMLNQTAQSADLSLGLHHCWASLAQPVPPAAGGYVMVDSTPMLAAAATVAISAVLVLPRMDGMQASPLPPLRPEA
jgi:hypothetical protein